MGPDGPQDRVVDDIDPHGCTGAGLHGARDPPGRPQVGEERPAEQEQAGCVGEDHGTVIPVLRELDPMPKVAEGVLKGPGAGREKDSGERKAPRPGTPPSPTNEPCQAASEKVASGPRPHSQRLRDDRGGRQRVRSDSVEGPNAERKARKEGEKERDASEARREGPEGRRKQP